MKLANCFVDPKPTPPTSPSLARLDLMLRTVGNLLGWSTPPPARPLSGPRRLRIRTNRFLPIAFLLTVLFLVVSSQRARTPATATTKKKPGSILARHSLGNLFGAPRADLGRNISFTAYLDQHFPQHTRLPKRRQPDRLWLTVSDETWVDSGTAALQVFVERLNEERRGKFGGTAARTSLVVLCVDAQCIEKCEERGMYCYGGFMYSKPKKVSSLAWSGSDGVLMVGLGVGAGSGMAESRR